MKIRSEFTQRGSSAVPSSLRSELAPSLACFAAAIALWAPHAVAQTPAPGPRELPAKTMPVPDSVSPPGVARSPWRQGRVDDDRRGEGV